MIDIDKLMNDLNEAIEEGLVYIRDEVRGHKPATDARLARMMGTTWASLVIDATPKRKDTQDERNN